MPRSIEIKQRRLLYELDLNPRASFAQLSKTLRIPEETVRYRTSKLLSEGIAQTFYPVISVGRLGMSIHKLMFKLHNVTDSRLRAMLDFLAAHRQVNWVAQFDGSYDLGCTVWIRELGELAQLLDETRRRFYAQIKEISYAVNMHAEFFPRDYLIRSKRSLANRAIYSSSNEDVSRTTLDSHDMQILKLLSLDARQSIAELARAMNVAHETARTRLQRLERNGIITGYRMVLNHEAVGMLSYYLLLKLHSVANERLDALLRFLRAHPAVVYMIRMVGGWDYDVSIEVENVQAYRHFRREVGNHFADVVREAESLVSWKVEKFSILPPNLDITAMQRLR